MSFLRQNEVETLFRRNDNVIIASCARFSSSHADTDYTELFTPPAILL